MVEVLREGLSQTIHVIENGKRKKITKMQAVFNRIIDKSIAGDTSASRVLLMFAHVLNDAANASPAELEELDKKALRSLFENYGLKPPEE
jgi:hypothetical protein